MRTRPLAALIATIFAFAAAAQPDTGARFEGAMVYSDGRFEARTLSVRDGLVAPPGPPEPGHKATSLAGMYILPAFGDAHTHRFTGSDAPAVQMFLSAGFVYIHNLNGAADSRRRCAGDANTPTTPDVRFANAGFTATGGHPVPLYTYLDSMNRENDPATVMSRIADVNFYIVDSVAQVGPKWDTFIATRPDGVKLFLLNSQRWDAPVEGSKSDGLRPEVAREIGRRAKAAGLRAFAHVESAADAIVAREAGVALLAHMPGYAVNADTPEATASANVPDEEMLAAAKAGIAMTPTLGLIYADPKDVALVARVKAWKRGQVSRWRGAGVPILYGSDNYFDITGELRAMIESGLWTGPELVDMVAVRTPRWIFPDRAVGSLEPGSEATFVVLTGNPLERPEAMLEVQAVYKAGREIWRKPVPVTSPPPPPPAAAPPAPGRDR
jgi:imidazolonepropionase-like amidohydrolase